MLHRFLRYMDLPLYLYSGLLVSIFWIVLFHYTSTLVKDQIGKEISKGAVVVAARSRGWVPRFTSNELIHVGRLFLEFSENTDG